MSEGHDEGPGGSPPPGPLSDTFPEFVRYARNRQRTRATRQLAPQAPPPTARPALTPLAAVVLFFTLVIGWRVWSTAAPHEPAPGEKAKITPSAWMDLPRPAKMGEVPDAWGGLHLGMREADIDRARLEKYTAADRWADAVYRPVRAKAGAFLGLSFHHERLYRIAVRYGDDSRFSSGFYLGPATVAYGPHRGYEYPTLSNAHAVTIFQTESRALKLDSVKNPGGAVLDEVSLTDMEAGAARALERARGH